MIYKAGHPHIWSLLMLFTAITFGIGIVLLGLLSLLLIGGMTYQTVTGRPVSSSLKTFSGKTFIRLFVAFGISASNLMVYSGGASIYEAVTDRPHSGE